MGGLSICALQYGLGEVSERASGREIAKSARPLLSSPSPSPPVVRWDTTPTCSLIRPRRRRLLAPSVRRCVASPSSHFSLVYSRHFSSRSCSNRTTSETQRTTSSATRQSSSSPSGSSLTPSQLSAGPYRVLSISEERALPSLPHDDTTRLASLSSDRSIGFVPGARCPVDECDWTGTLGEGDAHEATVSSSR